MQRTPQSARFQYTKANTLAYAQAHDLVGWLLELHAGELRVGEVQPARAAGVQFVDPFFPVHAAVAEALDALRHTITRQVQHFVVRHSDLERRAVERDVAAVGEDGRALDRRGRALGRRGRALGKRGRRRRRGFRRADQRLHLIGRARTGLIDGPVRIDTLV